MARDEGLELVDKEKNVSTPVILKVKGLRGKYGSAFFGNDFTSTDPATLNREGVGRHVAVEPSLAQEIMERFKGFVKVMPAEQSA